MPRFTIRRAKVGSPAFPWALNDADHPIFIGQYRKHEHAIRAAENRARKDLGLPTIEQRDAALGFAETRS